jgi:hypothetical protein
LKENSDVNTISIKGTFLLTAWIITCCAQVGEPGDDLPLEEQLDESLMPAGGQEGMTGDSLLVPPSTGGLSQDETIARETTDMAGETSVANIASGGSVDTSQTGVGGVEPANHPLFGEGSYSSADLDDPCSTSQFWRVEAAIELTTDTLVIHDGQLWKLTGEANENWALEDCTPPGTGWCADQYAWEAVGTCPEE